MIVKWQLRFAREVVKVKGNRFIMQVDNMDSFVIDRALSRYLLAALLFLTLCLTTYPSIASAEPLIRKRWTPPTLQPKLPKPVVTPAARLLLKPELNVLIVIDPGHGGKDKGAHSKKVPKYQEKYLTLTTAFMLKEYLTRMGYEVLLTRTKDVFISLDQRAAFANKQQPHIFVSLHYNTAPNAQAEGIEIFFYRSDANKQRSKDSEALAKSILKRVLSNTGAKSRGVKHGNLAVIRETNVPAVLVEGGFLSNAEEVLKIKDAAYLKQLSWGIAQGINEYLEK